MIPPAEGAVFEEMGPCPYCERGYTLEFPSSGRGPWGPDGYWQGRGYMGLEPQQDSPPLPPQEQRALLNQLVSTVGLDIG